MSQPINTSLLPEALEYFDHLPDSAYIRLPILKALYACSPASIWRGVKNGTIPKPVKLTERTTAWNVGLIRAALAEKVAA